MRKRTQRSSFAVHLCSCTLTCVAAQIIEYLRGLLPPEEHKPKDAQQSDIQDALNTACEDGDLAAAKDAVAQGADVCFGDTFQYEDGSERQDVQPIHEAAMYGHLSVMGAWLVEHGADVNAEYACTHSDGEVCKSIQPIHLAAQFDVVADIQFLIQHGASITAAASSGHSALHIAELYKSTEVTFCIIPARSHSSAQVAEYLGGLLTPVDYSAVASSHKKASWAQANKKAKARALCHTTRSTTASWTPMPLSPICNAAAIPVETSSAADADRVEESHQEASVNAEMAQLVSEKEFLVAMYDEEVAENDAMCHKLARQQKQAAVMAGQLAQQQKQVAASQKKLHKQKKALAQQKARLDSIRTKVQQAARAQLAKLKSEAGGKLAKVKSEARSLQQRCWQLEEHLD